MSETPPRDDDRERPERRDGRGSGAAPRGARPDPGDRPGRGARPDRGEGPVRRDGAPPARKPYAGKREGERTGSSRDGKPPYAGKPRDGKTGEGRSSAGKGRDGKPPYASKTGDGKPPYAGRPRDGKPPARDGYAGKPRDGKPHAAKSREGGGGRPGFGGGRDGARSGGGPRSGDERLWTRGGRPARGDSSASIPEPREDTDPFGTKSVRSHHDDPFLPDDVTPKDLDRIARNELKTLAAENQEVVARHLAMAARLIEEDPERAHQHAISAARRAGRIGVARESLAITAYAVGDYALALRELRTYRRITGRDDQLPMMVDSERGLGRPERALELGRSVPRSALPAAVQVELAIAMSGARLDQGDAEAALRELEIPQLDASTAFAYSPALFGAYATVLEELGRESEAAEWFRRADVAAAALGEDDDELVEIIEEEIADGSEAATGEPGEPQA